MHKIVFLVVVLLIIGLLDFYIWQAFKFAIRNFGSTSKTIFNILYWSLPAIIVLGILLYSVGIFKGKEKYFMLIVGGSFVLNLLPKMILLVFVLIDDLVRGGKFTTNKISELTNNLPKQSPDPTPESNTISRSDFIIKTGLAAAAIPFAATSFGILSGAYDYRVRHKTLVYPNLPKAFDGIRIAQISDVHSGSFYNKTAVMGGIDLLNAQKPDLVFFTGDLINDRATEVRDYIHVFDKIKSPLGVHSILGNHDYGMYVNWESDQAKLKNIQDVIAAHGEMGWKILLNQNRQITVDGESIGLLGVENWGHGFIKAGDLHKTYKGTEENEFKILLSHDPSHWRDEVLPNYSDIDLTLSGHTHGMQFGIEIGNFQWSPVQYRYKEWGGLYTEGKQNIYVNRGYGFIGFPGRIGILPEITILELKRA